MQDKRVIILSCSKHALKDIEKLMPFYLQYLVWDFLVQYSKVLLFHMELFVWFMQFYVGWQCSQWQSSILCISVIHWSHWVTVTKQWGWSLCSLLVLIFQTAGAFSKVPPAISGGEFCDTRRASTRPRLTPVYPLILHSYVNMKAQMYIKSKQMAALQSWGLLEVSSLAAVTSHLLSRNQLVSLWLCLNVI